MTDSARIDVSLTGKQRYWQAVKKARLRFDRDWREYYATGKLVIGCGLDRERNALIAEFDRLTAAIRQLGGKGD